MKVLNEIATVKVTEQKMQNILRTALPLLSEEFWQSESEDVAYMDSSKKAVIENCVNDGLLFGNKLGQLTLYYINDLQDYVAVFN